MFAGCEIFVNKIIRFLEIFRETYQIFLGKKWRFIELLAGLSDTFLGDFSEFSIRFTWLFTLILFFFFRLACPSGSKSNTMALNEAYKRILNTI